MKHVSTKCKTRDGKSSAMGPSEGGEAAYSYGLALCLDTEILEKLDIDVADLKVGQKLTLEATVEVVSLSINQRKGGDEQQGASLQITEMGLGSGPKGKSLYKEDE